MNDFHRRILPGFRLALWTSLLCVSAMVVLPFAAVGAKGFSLGLERFKATISTPRVLAACQLTFGLALFAALLATLLGLLVAWVLVRQKLPLRRLCDALVDVPLALPTAVAGLVYASLYASNGLFGAWFARWDISIAYTRLGILLVLVFVSFPLAVRTVQPVVANLEREVEEAAACLGASRLETLIRVQLPQLIPALLTGFMLAFSRAAGEYGSVIFISGNKPFETEIAAVLIVGRLEEFAYAEAAAIGTVLLVVSLALLLLGEFLRRWGERYVA